LSSSKVNSIAILTRIVNVVATAALDRSVDLESLAKRFPEVVSYDPDLYFAAYFKSKGMKGKVSIFSSGKMISVGTKTIEDAKRDLAHVSETVENAGLARLKDEPKVQNIVATADLGVRPDLERIMENIHLWEGAKAIYEPEQFPGVIIQFPLSNEATATILLFSSGKLVCVGLKRREDIQAAIERLEPLLR